MNWKKLKEKTWIDWIKVVVALDIAGVGIGLILGFDMHVLAHIFGFLSRIIFGVLYVFVAVLIFKRVFPQNLAIEEQTEAQKMNDKIKDTTERFKDGMKQILQKLTTLGDTLHTKIDQFLDKGEDFTRKRKEEIKKEVDILMKD
jgi:hypothetical protein